MTNLIRAERELKNPIAKPIFSLLKLKWLQPLLLSLVIKYVKQNLINREQLINLSQREPNNKFYSLQYQESIDYDDSFSFDETPPIIQEKKGWFNFTIPFVSEIHNLHLIGPQAIGIKDKKIVLETALGREDCLEKGITATLEKGFSLNYFKPSFDNQYIDFACSLINCWSDLYAHWITECLTRLEGIELYYQKTGERPKLIIEKDPPFWKTQSLEMMGYGRENYIEWQGYRAKVGRFVIPSNRREQRRQSIKGCRWVGERVVSNLNSMETADIPLSPYIIISRKKALCRRVINEDELNQSLAKRGFLPYILEDLDFPTQVKLFAQAKIIVGPHGAGFSNMIFSQNPIILEVLGPTPNYFFYTLSKGLGFKHGFLLCEPRGEDMIVNCGKLIKLLDLMLNNYSNPI